MDRDGLEGPALLAAAVELAATVHAGQLDQAGLPYLSHPLRVAARLVPEGEWAVAAGLLHDVVEDSATTVDDLRAAGMPPVVCAAVDALSKRPGEPYEQAVARAAAHRLAATVKAADLADNSDPARLALLDPERRERLETKYALARQLLEEHTGGALDLDR